MELTLFVLIFIFGCVVYYLSTKQSDIDISNVYQMQLSFLSLVTWSAMAFNSFNIEFVYVTTSSIQRYSIIDYTCIGLSLAFVILSLLNIIILGIYGSWNMMFKQYKVIKEDSTYGIKN